MAKLDALSPLKVLNRGFSIVSAADGRGVKSVTDLKKNDAISIRMTDGNANCIVESVEEWR